MFKVLLRDHVMVQTSRDYNAHKLSLLNFYDCKHLKNEQTIKLESKQ